MFYKAEISYDIITNNIFLISFTLRTISSSRIGKNKKKLIKIE